MINYLIDIEISCRILVGKSAETRPLERHRRRWEDSIIMDIKEIIRVFDDVD
jgi:hypothetical protein